VILKTIPNAIGFRITGGKGFHMTFANGYTVSVQWGPGNYCDNYNERISQVKCAETGSSTAECAVWGPNGNMIEYGEWENTVSNRSTPADVLALLNWAASQRPADGE
jgi:hypothetical protein